ncbi:MAG: hypothetical protein A2512_11375 [Deltaproteobacteria bacterium RIFOXYD12_FULL_56_24]|nr:MAG: hypothetical protein A2512_11375 [Deltaproteobacteria bacterium RIFOXYD12_FULL_56_24]
MAINPRRNRERDGSVISTILLLLIERYQNSDTQNQKPFSSAADARKRPAKCAVAHEQADDKADAVLLGGFFTAR